jgi:hypothetical protein
MSDPNPYFTEELVERIRETIMDLPVDQAAVLIAEELAYKDLTIHDMKHMLQKSGDLPIIKPNVG